MNTKTFWQLIVRKEGDGYDQADLDLTDHQVQLIQAVTAAQPKTVVILNNGSAVTMSTWNLDWCQPSLPPLIGILFPDRTQDRHSFFLAELFQVGAVEA